MLVLNDYVFNLNKDGPITKYWICIFKGCPAKANTHAYNTLTKQTDEHCHPAGEDKTIREFRTKVKERAVKETTPIPRIYDEECEKVMLSLAAISILPSERELSKQHFRTSGNEFDYTFLSRQCNQ